MKTFRKMKVAETFRKLEGYWLNQLINDNPSCFNGEVSVEKYRITIEKIEEPKEVYKKRLQKLWDECSNYQNWKPLEIAAKRLGVELIGHAGNNRQNNNKKQ